MARIVADLAEDHDPLLERVWIAEPASWPCGRTTASPLPAGIHERHGFTLPAEKPRHSFGVDPVGRDRRPGLPGTMHGGMTVDAE